MGGIFAKEALTMTKTQLKKVRVKQENKKTYKISTSVKDGILEVVAKGELAKPTVEDMVNEIILIERSANVKNQLVDVRKLKGSNYILDVYFYDRKDPSTRPRMNIAFIDPPEDAATVSRRKILRDLRSSFMGRWKTVEIPDGAQELNVKGGTRSTAEPVLERKKMGNEEIRHYAIGTEPHDIRGLWRESFVDGYAGDKLDRWDFRAKRWVFSESLMEKVMGEDWAYHWEITKDEADKIIGNDTGLNIDFFTDMDTAREWLKWQK